MLPILYIVWSAAVAADDDDDDNGVTMERSQYISHKS